MPLVDSFRIASNKNYLTRKLNEDNKNIEIRVTQPADANEEIKIDLKLNGDTLLVYYGEVLENNEENDCLSLTLTFSERKDDKLTQARIKFFSRYFLFDRNHSDIIEQCIYLNKPFDRRVMFYYYVLLMDMFDLEKEDPKRSDLHEDKIIVSSVKDNLVAIETLSSSIQDEEAKLLNKDYTSNPMIIKFIKYKIQQKRLLRKYIEIFENHLLFLIKDEAL